MRAIARLLADLSRARRALLLGLSLLCVLVAVGLGLGLEGLVRSHRAEAERHRWSFWQVTQAQIELQRFSAALARSAAGDPAAAAELPLRLDLLWGRIQQLEILESWEDSPGLSALLDRLPEMLGVLRLIEEALPPAPGRLPELLARLSRLEEPLVEAGRLLHAIRQDRERARQLEVARHVAAFAAGFLLLVLANAVLVALLWRRSLQAQAAQRRAEEASAHSRAASLLLRTVIDHTPALISAYGPDLRCVFVNRAVVEYTGRPEQELVGRRPTEAGLSPVLEADLQAVLAQGQPIAAREREFVHADGSRRVLLVTTAPVAAEAGLPVRLLRIGLDVTERREAERRAQHLIEHDGLTGLVNRAQFARALAAAAEQAASRPFALHVIDLDQFRRVNDSHGQAAGDTVLLAAAARLRGIIRAGDLAARLGGDEFAVLQRIGDPADAAALAQRVVAVLAQPYQVNGVSVRCTASLGAVAVHQPGDPPEALFARAELALREARRAGRGRFALFRPEMEDEAAARRALQADLVQALAEGGLHIVFQPKFRLPGRRLAGVEALLRWTHPRHGPLSPALFVPLAEEAGLALPLAR
ncbi:MAG: diguanylate cyclase, partial [Rhodovarius sp.]|nr:diguanylate cyclase [Rhodovarius sp.]